VKFGVAATASAITSLTFVSSEAAFEFSNVAAVPDPCTYVTLLSGLAAVGTGLARAPRIGLTTLHLGRARRVPPRVPAAPPGPA
jgi:hypothetical protein